MGTDGKAAAPGALWRTRSAPQRSCLHNGERLISEKHRKRRLTVINGAATSVRSMQLETPLFAELEGKQLPLLRQYFFSPVTFSFLCFFASLRNYRPSGKLSAPRGVLHCLDDLQLLSRQTFAIVHPKYSSHR